MIYLDADIPAPLNGHAPGVAALFGHHGPRWYRAGTPSQFATMDCLSANCVRVDMDPDGRGYTVHLATIGGRR